MLPDPQPGRETAQHSEKPAVASYITQIHRSIHEGWAWGLLDQLDARGPDHPLNDFNLWTRVEIVLTGDGGVEHVITVHASGRAAFDAAAREVVMAVGPFRKPPAALLSEDGKVYIHWALHRDERACGTFGAQPFVLDASGGDRPEPDAEVRPSTPSPPPVAHRSAARRHWDIQPGSYFGSSEESVGNLRYGVTVRQE